MHIPDQNMSKSELNADNCIASITLFELKGINNTSRYGPMSCALPLPVATKIEILLIGTTSRRPRIQRPNILVLLHVNTSTVHQVRFRDLHPPPGLAFLREPRGAVSAGRFFPWAAQVPLIMPCNAEPVAPGNTAVSSGMSACSFSPSPSSSPLVMISCMTRVRNRSLHGSAAAGCGTLPSNCLDPKWARRLSTTSCSWGAISSGLPSRKASRVLRHCWENRWLQLW